jgi:hypothetical protein
MAILFDQGDGLSKEVWVGQDWKLKLWSRGRRFFSFKKSKLDKILDGRLEGFFWAGNKVGFSFFMGWVWTSGLAFGGFTLWPSKLRGRGSSWPNVWTLGLAFEGFTLCLAEGSNSYILLAILTQFLRLSTKIGHSISRHLDLGRP